MTAKRRARGFLWVLGLTVLGFVQLDSPQPAAAGVAPQISLEEVIRKSDYIFTAVCETKQTELRKGNILSVYKIRPKEVWKGKPKLDKDGTVTIEQIGGSMGNGPVRIGQSFSASVVMVPGEELLLFTKNTAVNKELEKLGSEQFYTPGTLQVVARDFGRFSILTDTDTGGKYVVRMGGMTSRGIGSNDLSVRSYLNAQAKAHAAAQSGKALDEANKSAQISTSDLQAVLDSTVGKDAADERAKLEAEAGEVPEITNFEDLGAVRARVTQAVKHLPVGK